MQRVLEFTQNLYRVLSLDSAHKPSIVGPRARGLQTLSHSEFVPESFGTFILEL